MFFFFGLRGFVGCLCGMLWKELVVSRKVVLREEMMTRWWFQIFLFSPRTLGKIPILTNIFQLG